MTRGKGKGRDAGGTARPASRAREGDADQSRTGNADQSRMREKRAREKREQTAGAGKGRDRSNGSHVLAVDPGETTGLAWCSLGLVLNPEVRAEDGSELLAPVRGVGVKDERFVHLFDWGQIDGSIGEQTVKLMKGIVRLNVRVIVTESSDHFLLAPRKGAFRKASLVPIQLEGAVAGVQALWNANVTERHLTWVRQQPAQAKTVINDGIMRAYGFDLATSGVERHAKDALRHLILFLRRMEQSKNTPHGFAQTIAADLRQ